MPGIHSGPTELNTYEEKEEVPHNILLILTEHTVTSIETPAILVEFQKWLEVLAHVYDEIHRKNFQQSNLRRNIFNNSGT